MAFVTHPYFAHPFSPSWVTGPFAFMEPRTLSRPPVVEVVSEFRVEYSEPYSVERAHAFVSGFRQQFPLIRDVQEPTASDEAASGVIAYSEGDTRALQVGPWGFAFNDLTVNASRPYESWDQIEGVARPLWESFVETLGVKRVVHLGLRYSNILRLNRDDTGERKLLNSWSSFSDLILRDPDSFVLRMNVPLAEPGLRATIVHVLSHPEGSEGEVEVVVDNDVYAPNVSLDPAEVWETFERLRVAKNTLFYDARTDAALKQYR